MEKLGRWIFLVWFVFVLGGAYLASVLFAYDGPLSKEKITDFFSTREISVGREKLEVLKESANHTRIGKTPDGYTVYCVFKHAYARIPLEYAGNFVPIFRDGKALACDDIK